MTMDTPVRLAFSHEELCYLLRLLRLPGLPGMSIPVQMGVPAEYEPLALGTAERTLRARGVLNRENDQAVLDAMVAGVIGLCARPQIGLVARWTRTADRVLRGAMYNLTEQTCIKHWSDEGVHTFEVLSPEAIASDVTHLMQPGESPTGGASLTGMEVTGSALVLAVVNAYLESPDPQKLWDSLSRLQMPEAEATLLIEAMQNGVVGSGSVGMWRGPDTASILNMAVLELPGALWLLHPVIQQGSDARYRIESVSHEGLQQSLIDQLNRLVAG